MTAAVKITETDKGFKKIQIELKKIDGSFVEIGYFSEDEHPSGVPVASIAAVHEFGAPKKNIPQRSFMRSTLAKKEGQYFKMIDGSKGEIFLGRSSVLKELNDLGETVTADFVTAIIDLKSPALKAETIARKGSSNPLVDTKAMADATKHKVTI